MLINRPYDTWWSSPTDFTVRYPLFHEVVSSQPRLFEGCQPTECTFEKMKQELVTHYYNDEINYYVNEFVQKFNQELRRQVLYLDHCIRTSKLEYDKMNYNKNETHVTSTGTSNSNSISKFQDTPVNSVINSDNYETNVTKNNANTNGNSTEDTVFFHQTELKTNQDILLSEYDVYRNPFELLFKKLNYLFIGVW